MHGPAELPFSARFFGSRTNEGVDEIDTRTQEELLASASQVEQPGVEAENRNPEQLANATYQKWYAQCLKVFSSNETQRYEHPSEEIRLKMLRLPPLEEDRAEGDEEALAPCLSVTLELFWNDPLRAAHMTMWTHNLAAMAMFFAGLELMEREVDVN
jgi:hypothetical protein